MENLIFRRAGGSNKPLLPLAKFASVAVELSEIFHLRKGWKDEVVIGPLASEGVVHLRSSTDIVRLSRNSLIHIEERHGSITDFEIITIAYGLAKGMYISDSKRENHLIINYIYPDTGFRYKAAVKCANKGQELWVSTFHRLRPRQTKPLLKRGALIRPHLK